MSTHSSISGDPLELALGERLYIARSRAGFGDATKFSKASGISVGTIGNYEKGRTRPSPVFLRVWADTVGLTVDELTGHNGEAGPEGGPGLSLLPGTPPGTRTQNLRICLAQAA